MRKPKVRKLTFTVLVDEGDVDEVKGAFVEWFTDLGAPAWRRETTDVAARIRPDEKEYFDALAL